MLFTINNHFTRLKLIIREQVEKLHEYFIKHSQHKNKSQQDSDVLAFTFVQFINVR